VAQLIETFLAEHVRAKRKASTIQGYERVLKGRFRAEYGARPAAKLTRADIAKLHIKLAVTPSAANYTLAAIGSMFGFAQRRGLVPEGTNPATKIEKYAEKGRERFLTLEEIGRLGDAIREAETVGLAWRSDKPMRWKGRKPENRKSVFDPYATAALRLLLLTGCRLREVLHLKWEHVDFERGIAFLPDSKTGRKPVVLNSAALAQLAALPRLGPYVVPGADPNQPRHDLKRVWAAVSARAGLSGVRLHDLRHTHASIGVGSGMGLPIVGRLLGHSQPATTARYAHLDSDPLRRASDRIGSTIAAALEGGPTAEVVPVKRRGS
jgi:integrase